MYTLFCNLFYKGKTYIHVFRNFLGYRRAKHIYMSTPSMKKLLIMYIRFYFHTIEKTKKTLLPEWSQLKKNLLVKGLTNLPSYNSI